MRASQESSSKAWAEKVHTVCNRARHNRCGSRKLFDVLDCDCVSRATAACGAVVAGSKQHFMQEYMTAFRFFISCKVQIQSALNAKHNSRSLSSSVSYYYGCSLFFMFFWQTKMTRKGEGGGEWREGRGKGRYERDWDDILINIESIKILYFC